MMPEKSCETCSKNDCPVKKDEGLNPASYGCWEPRVRRPKDFTCVLSMFAPADRQACRGSRCYLWSRLEPEYENGMLGTCLVALIASKAAGLLAGHSVYPVSHGVALEEGEAT